MKTPREVLQSLRKQFDNTSVLQIIKSCFKAAGIKTIYMALLLFYAYNRDDTPTWARRIILGTLAYLVAPIDAIPDLSPFLGFTDDFGVLMFGLVSVIGHIDTEVRKKARFRVEQWFGHVYDNTLEEVENSLNL